METETPKAAPILEIAWMRYAQLNASSIRRTNAYKQLRIWIAVLGVLATLFSIIVAAFFQNGVSLLGAIFKFLFILTPIVASLLAAFGTRRFASGDWLITRAAAEEYLKEIYFFRTILRNRTDRREYLEKRINEIQRQLYRGLGGELAFRPYNGPIPPYYKPEYGNDPGFSDLAGDEYFKYRLEDQLRWHIKEVNEYKRERGILDFLVLGSGGLGTLIAAIATQNSAFSLWVALAASITAAVISWQQLRNIDTVIKNYSKVILELTMLYDHWNNLEPEERTAAEFFKMVRGCEEVLWAQNTEYIKSMQEALKDSDLEKEASLVNRVIKESVESAERAKEAMANAAVEQTRQTLQETEQKVEETFKATLGSLAEEASSELVQKELAAMSQAVTEAAGNAIQGASSLTATISDLVKEYAHIDLSRDTKKEDLNSFLARLPKTSDVKG